MRYLFGIFWFKLGLVLLMLINGDWQLSSVVDFIDAGSFLLFVFAITTMVIITNQSALFLSAVKAMFFRKHRLIPELAARAVRLFKLLRKTVWYTAVLGTIVAVVLMMRNLQDMDVLAANTALSFLFPFYGVFINIIFVNPAINIFESQALSDGDDE